jgi:Tol biopolymer transport system component
MTFGSGPAPFEQIRWDLASAGYEPFFKEPGPCEHALRPGWSLDGEQVALVCTGDDELPEGIYVAGADGSDPRLVVDDPLVAGSPSWVSNTEFIFGIKSSADPDESVYSFRRGYADGRPSEPFDVGVDDAEVTHIDWSPEAEKLLFLVSPFGGEEIGSVWTVNADGSDAQLVADGSYAHPVWSPDGESIGVTVVDGGTEALAYVPLDDPSNPVIVPDPPEGEVGIPVWGTR